MGAGDGYFFGIQQKPCGGESAEALKLDARGCFAYSRVPGDRNWHIETADWNLAALFTIFRNLLAGILGSFLRFIETGFRNWV